MSDNFNLDAYITSCLDSGESIDSIADRVSKVLNNAKSTADKEASARNAWLEDLEMEYNSCDILTKSEGIFAIVYDICMKNDKWNLDTCKNFYASVEKSITDIEKMYNGEYDFKQETKDLWNKLFGG